MALSSPYPSSPPLVLSDASDTSSDVQQEEQAHADANSGEAATSSVTLLGENASVNPRRESAMAGAQPPLSGLPSIQAHSSMAPPPVPQKVPPSGQGSSNPSEASSGIQQPAKSVTVQIPDSSVPSYSTAPETQRDVNSTKASQPQDEPPQPDDIPEEKIEDFDWGDHEARYHDKMSEFHASEVEILQEFGSLCQYFDIWAQAGANHEVDRSFKRMKTQATLVQHHEDELEQERQHYIRVVDAFKSALQLLAK